MAGPAVQVDGFELLAEVGRGGQGSVWRARSTRSDHLVAVKLGRPDRELDPGVFLREAAAMAQLHHPVLAMVYDFGVAGDHPYIVMELVDGGTLGEHPPTTWSDTLGLARLLLDGLAHAHARGVVHRDLKPANVLRDPSGPWRIVDFGIAGIVGHASWGTPLYMAPEQLTNSLTELGPWTDLFALGTVLWQLVSGRLPRTGSPTELLRQAWGPLPELRPRFAVPEGVQAWLAGLLAPDPEDRFQCAADAAWQLAGLGDVASPASAPPMSLPETATFTLEALDRPEPRPGRVTTPSRGAPPVPVSGDRAVPPRRVPANLGLGLIGLRERPLVGRSAEMRSLWSTLRAVHAGGRRVVWVHGPSGCGRSRLLGWLGQRAEEVGAATVVHLAADEPDPLTTIGGRLLRLPAPEATICRRLERLLSRTPRVGSAVAWSRALADRAQLDASESAAVAAGLLEAASARRPVVVLLDDVDRSSEAWQVVERLDPEARVLVVASSLEAPPPDLTGLALSWLSTPAVERLLVESAGLSPSLAAALADDAGGSPRHALGAVASLASRGLLGPGSDGLVSLPGTAIRELDRLEPWLAPLSEPEAQAWELVACHGGWVALEAWRQAGSLAGLPVSSRGVAAGTRLGLVAREPDRLRLVDAEIRELWLARARAGGRLTRWHRVWASVFESLDVPERVARHLVAAGDERDAVPSLWRAAILQDERRNTTRATVLWHTLIGALERHGSEEEVWEARGWLAWTLFRDSRTEQARDLALAVREAGERLGSKPVQASALHTLSIVALWTNQDFAPLLRAAIVLYRETDSPHLAAAEETLLTLQAPEAVLDACLARIESGTDPNAGTAGDARYLAGQTLLWLGRPEEALPLLGEAAQAFRDAGSPSLARLVRRYVAEALVMTGELDEAEAELHELLRAELDPRHITAHIVQLELARIAVHRGDPTTALRVLSEVEGLESSGRAMLRSRHGAILAAALALSGSHPELPDQVPHSLRGKREHIGIRRLCAIAIEACRERGDAVGVERVERWASAIGVDLG